MKALSLDADMAVFFQIMYTHTCAEKIETTFNYFSTNACGTRRESLRFCEKYKKIALGVACSRIDILIWGFGTAPCGIDAHFFGKKISRLVLAEHPSETRIGTDADGTESTRTPTLRVNRYRSRKKGRNDGSYSRASHRGNRLARWLHTARTPSAVWLCKGARSKRAFFSGMSVSDWRHGVTWSIVWHARFLAHRINNGRPINNYMIYRVF